MCGARLSVIAQGIACDIGNEALYLFKVEGRSGRKETLGTFVGKPEILPDGGSIRHLVPQRPKECDGVATLTDDLAPTSPSR